MAYSLRTDTASNTEILVKDGVDVICPYQNAHLVPSAMGQIQMMRLPCSTNCAHASLTIDRTIYTIICGCEKKDFEIEEEELQKDKNSLRIV